MNNTKIEAIRSTKRIIDSDTLELSEGGDRSFFHLKQLGFAMFFDP
jgi:hypothetical protein